MELFPIFFLLQFRNVGFYFIFVYVRYKRNAEKIYASKKKIQIDYILVSLQKRASLPTTNKKWKKHFFNAILTTMYIFRANENTFHLVSVVLWKLLYYFFSHFFHFVLNFNAKSMYIQYPSANWIYFYCWHRRHFVFRSVSLFQQIVRNIRFTFYIRFINKQNETKKKITKHVDCRVGNGCCYFLVTVSFVIFLFVFLFASLLQADTFRWLDNDKIVKRV